ncbi:MAG: class I SAM-dependent methyltransferase [Candidatus Bathyarchaeota archaeon]|nr:class I SAM-dependent methyltransferase [Candidatus Bathyarchaeota archaeon]
MSTRRLKLCSTDYWDKQASRFNQKTLRMDELTQVQLNNLPLLPQYSVLEVGAGTGRITLPVAKQVKHVTASEPAVSMLELLKTAAKKEHLNNITYLNTDLEALSTKKLPLHDIVLASFSVFMLDLKKALSTIDALAKKSVYIFSSASVWPDKEMQKILYGDVVSLLPDYLYLYNILLDLEILANVKILDYTSSQSYDSLDDAVSQLTDLHCISSWQETKLRKYLDATLVESNGKLWSNQKRKAAMIWWTKTQ